MGNPVETALGLKVKHISSLLDQSLACLGIPDSLLCSRPSIKMKVQGEIWGFLSITILINNP